VRWHKHHGLQLVDVGTAAVVNSADGTGRHIADGRAATGRPDGTTGWRRQCQCNNGCIKASPP